MILVVIGIFTYNYSSNALKNKIGTYSEQLVERVAIELNEIQKSYERISDNVAFSDLIQQKLASFDELNDDEKIAFKSEVANSFSELIKTSTDGVAQDGYLFSKGLEAIKMNTASGLPDITDDEISRIFKEADNRDGNYSWETTRKNRYHLVLTRAIKSLTTQETIGYTYTEITENAFSNIYKDMNLGENADVFVLSQDGIVISSRGGEASSGVAVKDKSIIDKLNNSIRQKDGYTFTANIGGKDYLVAYAQIQDVPWYTVYTVPFAYINSEVSKIGWFILAT